MNGINEKFIDLRKKEIEKEGMKNKKKRERGIGRKEKIINLRKDELGGKMRNKVIKNWDGEKKIRLGKEWKVKGKEEEKKKDEKIIIENEMLRIEDEKKCKSIYIGKKEKMIDKSKVRSEIKRINGEIEKLGIWFKVG